jgi:hypothetical protein
MAERSTSGLSADADAYLAKFDPAQAGENEPDKGGQAYLDRFGPSVVGQRPNPYDAQSQADQLLDSIDPRVNGSGGPRAPQLSAQDQADQLLDSIDPRVSGWGPPKGAPQEPESSATGAFIRSAERSALPTAGGLAGAAAGAEAGGALGSFAGPIGAGVGAFGGGVAGAMLGGTAIESAQNWAISKLPTGVQSLFGGTQEQQKADWEEHEIAALMGGVAPYALTASPGFVVKELPAGATRLEQLLNTKTAQAAVGGTVMGGITLGQEASQGQLNEPRAWWNVALSTGLGMFLNRPNRLGETIMGAGATPVRGLIGGQPEPIARSEPTIAEAGDLKVAGPGVTEDVYLGTENQAKTAEGIAQDTRRQEIAAMATGAPAQDIRATARQMEPEVFARYDAAQQRFDSLQRWSSAISGRAEEVSEEPTPQLTALQERLNEARQELNTVGPEVGAAYRRAAEATGSLVEPADALARHNRSQRLKRPLRPSVSR